MSLSKTCVCSRKSEHLQSVIQRHCRALKVVFVANGDTANKGIHGVQQ